MFKAFVSKSHPEFSSNRQQDAQEFFLHLVNLVEVSKFMQKCSAGLYEVCAALECRSRPSGLAGTSPPPIPQSHR